jgi:tripartite-type tricarboxylate transporter receptor subunit TctC
MIGRVLIATLLWIGWALHFAIPAQAQSSAQTYPNRPIKVVVPFPAGGPTDGMARIVSDRLGAVLGQTIIVENRGGGAGGSVGAKAVATADPDGYTILMTPGGSLTSGPAVHTDIGYDPFKDFTPVAKLMETPQYICVHPSLPVKSLSELAAYARANPGKISWGSQGFGTGTHLLFELFKLETGTNMVHVPYRGTAPMLAAFLAGDIQAATDPSTTVLPHIQSGALRPIAVTMPARTAKLPDVMTTIEAGYPKLVAPFWLGVVAPAGTPADFVGRLNAAFRESLNDASARTRLDALGADIQVGTPQEFGKLLTEEYALWAGVVKAANISVQ